MIGRLTNAGTPNRYYFGLGCRYGETLWSRTWFGQFRELVMKFAVRNIERVIEDSHP